MKQILHRMIVTGSLKIGEHDFLAIGLRFGPDLPENTRSL